MSVNISYNLWREIMDFFARLVSPCKECVRGNKIRCWESRCPVFRFRGIAGRVESASAAYLQRPQTEQQHVAVEREIVEKLTAIGRPITPRELMLTTTNSKVNKCHAIERLIRRGVVKEIRNDGGSRKILLQKWNPKQTKETDNEN